MPISLTIYTLHLILQRHQTTFCSHHIPYAASSFHAFAQDLLSPSVLLTLPCLEADPLWLLRPNEHILQQNFRWPSFEDFHSTCKLLLS